MVLRVFRYTGFTAEHVRYLREKHHVYLQSTGRISIALAFFSEYVINLLLADGFPGSGLNSSNIAQVARSIKEMVNGRV